MAHADTPGSRHVALGVCAGVLSAAGFSLKAVLAKLVYRHGVDATTLLALRMAMSLPFYVLIAWVSARSTRESVAPLPRPLLVRTALVGIVGYFVASYLDFRGLEHITAGLERLTLYLYPTLVIAIGWIAFGRRIERREALALGVAYGGLALALSGNVTGGRAAHELAIGTAFVFASALTYAIYVVGSGELVHRVGSWRFTAIAMIAATAPMLALFVVEGGLGRLHAIGRPVLGLAALMAVFATVLPSLLMTEAIRRLGSSRASVVGSVGPVATIGLEALLLGEPITPRAVFGTVLVVLGVLGVLGVGRDATKTSFGSSPPGATRPLPDPNEPTS